eukprot:c38847_g1_i1 orf=1-150(-)
MNSFHNRIPKTKGAISKHFSLCNLLVQPNSYYMDMQEYLSTFRVLECGPN